jgi:hypothetical protein
MGMRRPEWTLVGPAHPVVARTTIMRRGPGSINWSSGGCMRNAAAGGAAILIDRRLIRYPDAASWLRTPRWPAVGLGDGKAIRSRGPVDWFRVGDLPVVHGVPRHHDREARRCSTGALWNRSFRELREVQGAESRRDFIHKLGICVKELRETRAWLRFAQAMELCADARLEPAVRECDQLLAILATSIRTARRNGGR